MSERRYVARRDQHERLFDPAPDVQHRVGLLKGRAFIACQLY